MAAYPKCRTCGKSIAPTTSRGRRPEYCTPADGESRSACKQFSDTFSETVRLARRVLASAASGNRTRAQRRILARLAELRLELVTEDTARLDAP